MPRQKLPLNEIFSIDQTTHALHRDARIIAPYLNIREIEPASRIGMPT